jgi:small-conductance mechanosensitive channel/CRP-like cAMP-binding protein
MSVTSMLRGEMAVAVAVALGVGLLLLALRPADRAATRNALIVLGLCGLALLGELLTASVGASAAAAVAADIATALIGVVLIRLTTLFVFRVVMPAVRVAPARIAEDLATAALFVGWGFAWLRLSGVDPTSLFATSAVVTAILAFSMQDTLGNVLGGVLLQLDRSVRLGDWIRIDDTTGRVTEIRWRHTAVETRNGETVVIPNGWLMKNRFTVLASRSDPHAPWRRWIRLSVDLSASPGRVCAVLEEAVHNAAIPNVALDPAPSAVLTEIGARFGNYALRYWLHDRGPDDATDSAVRQHIVAALARNGMKLSVAYQEQLIVKDNEAHREAERELEHARRLEALARVDLFAPLAEAEREMLAGHLVYAPFVAGDVITRQGAVAHWLYLIISGRAEIWLESPQGRTRINVLQAGDVAGEMGLLTGEPRRATVVALTDVVCYRLDKEGFSTVLAARPDIARQISKVLETRETQLEGYREAARGAQLPAHHAAILTRIRKFFGLEEEAVADHSILS